MNLFNHIIMLLNDNKLSQVLMLLIQIFLNSAKIETCHKLSIANKLFCKTVVETSIFQ